MFVGRLFYFIILVCLIMLFFSSVANAFSYNSWIVADGETFIRTEFRTDVAYVREAFHHTGYLQRTVEYKVIPETFLWWKLF
jgi:hypothetical protein